MSDFYISTNELASVSEILHCGDKVYLSGTVYTARDAAHKRIFEILDTKPLIKDSDRAFDMPEIKGNVTFENVTFGYDEEKNVQNEFSTDTKINENNFSKVLEIINECEKNSVFYNVYTNNMILTKSLNYNILFYHNENKKNPEDKKIKINVIDDMYNYIKNYEGDDLLKITISLHAITLCYR